MGVGMALSKQLLNINFDVFAIISDGECNEGSIWEAAMFASAKSIDNLIVVIDYNKWQATGRSKETLTLEPLRDKWESFGWQVIEIDGHEFSEILIAFYEAKKFKIPTVIIANTIKGKGVSFYGR